MGRNYTDQSGANNPNHKHGLRCGICAPGSEREGIYNSWMNMKGRCLRKSHPKYPRYGGRGITVYQEWLDFQKFYDWAVSSGWQTGYSIDRINNDGNYCPENCQWISMAENSRKKRTTKISLEQAGEIRNRLDSGESEYGLAKEYGVVHGTIWFIANNVTHVADGECSKEIKRIRAKNKK